MTVYIVQLLKLTIILTGITINISYGQVPVQTIPLPRPVVEWCLECDATVKILFKVIQNREDVIEVKNKEIEVLETKIDSYKTDSVTFKLQLAEKDTIISNSDKIIKTQTKEIKKKDTNKWLERGIWGGIIAVIIMVATNGN